MEPELNPTALGLPYRQAAGTRDLATLLGVSSNQIYMWSRRSAANGFPAPVAQRLVPVYPGDRKRAPLWDLGAVLDWFDSYTPSHPRRVRIKHGTPQGYFQHNYLQKKGRDPGPCPACLQARRVA